MEEDDLVELPSQLAEVYNLTDGNPEASSTAEKTTISTIQDSEKLGMTRQLLLILDVEMIMNNTRLRCAATEVETNICDCFSREIWPGKAMQQIVLLRRCFYPRRDVIKWLDFEEVVNCPGG